jgi:hypothetical protein
MRISTLTKFPAFPGPPKVETVLVDNPEMPPQGCGEPAITTMGGVIANAVYDAIGVRLYVLPMTPVRIKDALEKSRRNEGKECSKHLHSAVSLTIRLDSKPI